MIRPLLVAACSFLVSLTALAQERMGQDLLIGAEETKVLHNGMYDFRTLQVGERGKLIVKGSVTLVVQKFVTGEGATIEYQNLTESPENFSLNAIDASGVTFLYINANGTAAKDRDGEGPAGASGRNGRSAGNYDDLDGKSAHRGGQGGNGLPGLPGKHAANVSLYLPNLKVGSLLRVHANGGHGGKGQRGGPGGKGGDGATGHPAKDGGPGGVGGRGGDAGNAGKIGVFLVIADSATEQQKQDELKVLRLEYANSGGIPGDGGEGGRPGPGGKGAFGGGNGTRGSQGGLGAGNSTGAQGINPHTRPDERWVVTNVVTQTEYARHYAQVLATIQAAAADR